MSERSTAMLRRSALHVLDWEQENSVEGCGDSRDELMEEKFEEFVNDGEGSRCGQQS
jgi:hypothetical protein